MEKHCPTCGKRGLAVGIETLKSLLNVSLRQIDSTLVYRFCATEDCEIVYFASNENIFTCSALSVLVFQKARHNPDVLVCYCFQHRLGELELDNKTALLSDIQAGIDAGQCACELRNPQGNCCLGNVRAVLNSL